MGKGTGKYFTSEFLGLPQVNLKRPIYYFVVELSMSIEVRMGYVMKWCLQYVL